MIEKAKIYFMANCRMPTGKAHGIQLIKMCEAFLARGVDLELLVPRLEGDPKEIVKYYGLKVEIPVRKIWTANLYNYGRAGFIISSALFSLSCFLFFLLKRFTGKKFIIYTVDLDHFSFLPLALAWVPYFIEIHGEKKKTILHKYFFKQASGIFAINRFIKDELTGIFGVPPEKVMVKPNGIDLEKFVLSVSQKEARGSLGLPEGQKIILYAGRPYDWKGFDILFAAAKMLDKGEVIYFVGAAKKEAETLKKIKTIPPNLVFVGSKSFNEIPLWLAASDALLLLGTAKNRASYYFTSPMKLFEYMASRRPIVASSTPANTEVISANEAFLYEPDNAEELAAKISEVFQNRAVAESKAKAAHEKVRGFSWNKRAEEILNFLRNNTKVNL